MQTFLVLYGMPVATLEEWMKKPKEETGPEQKKMEEAWGMWMKEHSASVKETRGAGKTKRITQEGTVDTKNDLMLFSMAEAESHEAAAKLFEGHPHLALPGAWIEVMPANALPGMEKM